jgi:hypothetical protein
MTPDVEKIIVQFDTKAAEIYTEVFDQFLNGKSVTRKVDENVFKLQTAKFLTELKSRLERQSKKSAQVYSGKLHHELQCSLSAKVNYYLQEFQHKCNAW